MSTRATYGFKNSDGVKHIIYIHHDGYPSGAACYFWKMLVHPSKGSYATQFIRANDGAELTRNHECHGDTEFKYDLDKCGDKLFLTAYESDWGGSDRVWKSIFAGTLYSFLDSHKDFISKYDIEYDSFRPVKLPYAIQWMNKYTAKLHLYKPYGPISSLNAWKGKFEGSANWNHQIDHLNAIISEFPCLVDEEISKLLHDGAVR